MTKNNWWAYPTRWQTREDFSTPGQQGCPWGYDDHDICTENLTGLTYWYSNFSGTVYNLWSDPGAQVSPRDLMLDVIHQNWSTLPALFDGAFDCTAAGNAPSEDPFSVRINGTINLVSIVPSFGFLF